MTEERNFSLQESRNIVWLRVVVLAIAVVAIASSEAAWLHWLAIDVSWLRALLIILCLGCGAYQIKRGDSAEVVLLGYVLESNRLHALMRGNSEPQDVFIVNSCLTRLFIYLHIRELSGRRHRLLILPDSLVSRRQYHQLLAAIAAIRHSQRPDFF